MLTLSAKWRTLALLAMCFAAAPLGAQPLPPKTPVTPAVNSGGAQIIPVSLTNESVAAVVNGEKILVGEVKKVLDQRPFPNALTEAQKKDIRQAALDVLIEDVVMRQYLKKHVPNVGQEEFNKEWYELQDALKKQMKTMPEFLKESGQTQEQLQRDIIARLQWKSLLGRFCPDDKARTYYDANKVFFDKVFVRASHILIKLPANATPEQRAQVAERLRVWRTEILQGKATFEGIAKQYSECPSGKERGLDGKEKLGDIGQFPYKFVVVPEFARTAFSMKKGEISDVVQTVFGLHLIMVTDRTPGEPSTFDRVRETVREVWAQDEDLYQRILADERKKGAIKIELP